MMHNLRCLGISLLVTIPIFTYAQKDSFDLSLEQSLERLHNENKSLKIAGKEIELAKTERDKLNSFWYPNINAAGAFVHMSNKIEVRQSLSKFTDPAVDFVHSILPDDQLITSILEKIGQNTLALPLTKQNLTTIDANVVWPLFTGGKRWYASKIGKLLVDVSEVNQNQVGATQQALMITNYFGLRLGNSIIKVKEETYQSLKTHYEEALKMEQQGMINKAERLFAEVNMKEAERSYQSSKKDLDVANEALKSILNITDDVNINTTTQLFINEDMPPAAYFKELIPSTNYVVNQLDLQKSISDKQGKIARSGYMPNIAFIGKQTLYANGVDKYLMPRTMIGVGFTWNIFDGLDREKNVRQAKIMSQSLAIGKDKAISDLEVAVDKCHTDMVNALDNVKALNTTLEMTQELVRIRVKSFKEGMATSSDVVDAEVLLSQVKTAFLMAYYQYDVALANLLSLCGIPEMFQKYRLEGKTEII